ncbi:NLR family CARD domain-containing protein 4 [Holothuria leucospilota]|uniref:NLR family CARD domain-containing protein 4 n=1 Tax=Holothuria leucospilota TaxID=206669 RepID=A0A9Q1H2F3_HOLLE|nr:NLR family CARD domain-containing protein 4 [Holothuria leucospilota]
MIKSHTKLLFMAKPIPNYPVVKGCNNDQYCVLETSKRGNLTCTIGKIRPLVQLEWGIFDTNSANQISLLPREQVIRTNGETFDISVSTLYEIHTNLLNRLTLECRVVGSNLEVFHLSTKFDLLFSNDAIYSSSTEKYTSGTAETSEGPKSMWWIIIIVLTAVFVATLIYSVWRLQQKKRRDKKRTKGSLTGNPPEEETLPMVVEGARERNELRPVNVPNPTGGTLSLAGGPTVYSTSQDGFESPSVSIDSHQHNQERMQEFVTYLKKKYEDFYRSVQPIPYVRDKMYSVDEVFVEGGIQVLRHKDKFTGNEDWENLTSHEDIFQSLGDEPSMHILEGEPGYGKSMLALLIASAWCSSKRSFSKINVLIVLRLRQLEGFTSIYRAIKMFLLPKDADFSEEEIEGILKRSESGMIILDGLDEYPDKDMEAPSDFLDIVKGDMLQKYEVLLTTRTNCLPKKYPRRTKREKLTGFDKCARRCYLLKAVVNNDNDRANEIEDKLRGNPVLRDICQVPLCFVLFAHTIYENNELATCDSVTKFFHYVISCFHSHMKNKMEDDNVKKLELFENEHRELDEAAFDSLTKNQGQNVWDREELLQYVSTAFYEQYVSIGILLEEEVLQIKTNPGVSASDHIKYKTSVSFYHKLFCEWYASHYLVKYVEEHEQENLNKVFKIIDPFNLQYVYRFACGLSSHAARHIIKYLEANDETKYFAMLCTLEDIKSFDAIKQRTLQMCNKVEVTESQSRLLRRSVIQLLEIVSSHKIMVKILSIRNCFRYFNEEENRVILQPDFSLSVLTSLKELHLSERGREMTIHETEDILKYISLCEALDNLRLYHCLMPRLGTTIPCLSVLQSREVKVVWYPTTSVYRLNITTGTWGFKESVPLTNNEYNKLIREFRLTYQETAWQKARVNSETN